MGTATAADFRSAGGIPIPWRMATASYDHEPDTEPRAMLIHTRGHHLGAVDPTQDPTEQHQQWHHLISDMDSCTTCASVDWANTDPTSLAVHEYSGFFDLVPGARDIGQG